MYEQIHPAGESLPEVHYLLQIKVVTTLLKAGEPLGKMDQLRGLLEKHANSLSDRLEMSNLILFVLSEEHQKIKAELLGRKILVIFDSTTHLREALVSFQVHSQTASALLLNPHKSMTGEKIARKGYQPL